MSPLYPGGNILPKNKYISHAPALRSDSSAIPAESLAPRRGEAGDGCSLVALAAQETRSGLPIHSRSRLRDENAALENDVGCGTVRGSPRGASLPWYAFIRGSVASRGVEEQGLVTPRRSNRPGPSRLQDITTPRRAIENSILQNWLGGRVKNKIPRGHPGG